MSVLDFTQAPREISRFYAYYLLCHRLAVVNWIGEENTYIQNVEFGQRYFVKDFLSITLSKGD